MFRMENFFALNEIPDTDIATKGTEVSPSIFTGGKTSSEPKVIVFIVQVGLPTVGTLFLGVFVTLLPKASHHYHPPGTNR